MRGRSGGWVVAQCTIMPSLQRLLLVAGVLAASGALLTASNPSASSPSSTNAAAPVAVELQPLAAQVSRLVETLDYIGAPLAPADRQALDAAVREAASLPALDARGRETAHAGATAAMQKVLDATRCSTSTSTPRAASR